MTSIISFFIGILSVAFMYEIYAWTSDIVYVPAIFVTVSMLITLIIWAIDSSERWSKPVK